MKRLSKYILAGVVIVVFLIAILHFADAKTFKGRVIDADTKEPIQGAVVVAYWYKAIATIAGESTTLKDVKECLTDKNGRWSIIGPKGRLPGHGPIPPLSLFISYTREPQFIIFQPGYCSWPNGFSIDACRGKIKPEGSGKIMEGETVELPKLTNREERGEAQSLKLPLGPGSLEKMKELIRLKNEERRSLGLDEVYK